MNQSLFGQNNNNNFNQNWNRNNGNNGQFQNTGGNTQSSPLGPVASRYPQTQQSMPSQPPLTISLGRVVNSEEEISANDIPMNGSICLFLKRDLSCIYAKAWNNNFNIDSACYYLTPVPNQNNSSADDFQTQIFNRFDKIEAMLNSKQSYNKDKQNNRSGFKSKTGGNQRNDAK